ncbi:MAG: baseplate J/gp47 family protein [Pseudomonadota bacterium]
MTIIDLSRLPPPNAIESLDFEALQADFVARFLAAWEGLRALDPTLPVYNVESLQADPFIVAGQAYSGVRLLDRARVNDAVRAVLAPLARRKDLDNVVARLGVERLVVFPANEEAGTPAVMESDERLLRRYLLAFGRPSAGSAALYQYEALTAVPILKDVGIAGRAIHGRRGDTDVILLGPAGRDLTSDEIATARAAVNKPGVRPEATSVTVLPAVRTFYDVRLSLQVSQGPDASAVTAEADTRIRQAAEDRRWVGEQVPCALLSGAAYGLSVVRADLDAPLADIAGHPYAAPELGTLEIVTGVVG